MSVTNLSAWKQLNDLAVNEYDLNELFINDNERVQKYTLELNNIYLDYSKQLINDKVVTSLLNLAKQREMTRAIDALFSGGIVNPTENRPALHPALRLPKNKSFSVDNHTITDDIHQSFDAMELMINKLNSGSWLGHTGKAITDVINIGIGGSDLGPVMACEALSDYKQSPLNIHFVSSMDGNQIYQLLAELNAETTLVLVSSKSFSTKETIDNTNIALSWFCEHLSSSQESVTPQEVTQAHFIGISSKADKLTAWGIPTSNQLIFWEWVGGRYSFWSVIGFSLALSIGMDNFRAVLAGAHTMDEHFKSTALEKNLPVILGLLGVWNRTFLDIPSHAVLPYDARLKFLPNYLTQLEMESNGKSATMNGELVTYKTGAILWGDIGSNGQHAFYQLLHQGTETVACDFIATIKRYATQSESAQHQSKLIEQKGELIKMQQNSLANCLAQSRVLAFGNHALKGESNVSDTETVLETNHHKYYRGNQPSTTLLFDEFTPHTLGQLITLYEHKTYVMSVLWDINPFDQWGVELGKMMATELNNSIEHQTFGYDASTNKMLEKIYRLNNS